MTIEELKGKVLVADASLLSKPLILINNKNSLLLAIQYIEALSSALKLTVKNCLDIEEIPLPSGLFTDVVDDTLYVLFCNKLTCKGDFLKNTSNTIIVADNIDEKTLDLLKDYVIFLPELEEWQIKDYAYSVAEGVDTKSLDWLITLCRGDLLRLSNELKKISIFPQVQRSVIFDLCRQEGLFGDLSEYNIFDFSNALQVRDVDKLALLYPKIAESDVEPLGLITILYRNFYNMIQIRLNSRPTPENTGLPPNQFYAISRLPKAYSTAQLVKIFKYLLDVERKLKDGELPEEYINDLTILTILTA